MENLYEAWSYYIDLFNMDIRILEDDKTAELMLPTGGKPQRRHACITVNMQGGGGFEVWQYAERKPQPPRLRVEHGRPGGAGLQDQKPRRDGAAYEQFSKRPKANLVER